MTVIFHGPAAWEDLEVSRYRPVGSVDVGLRTGDPGAERITGLLMSPPSPAEFMAETEQLEFSD